MESAEKIVQDATRWLLKLVLTGQPIETRTLKGLKILDAQKGFLHCSYKVPVETCGEDEQWHVGAIATLIDVVGATAIYSVAGHPKASADFGISYFLQVKLHEEVEVVAKVVGNIERLASVVVEVRRKDSRELIALGKQWMAEAAFIPKVADVIKKTSKL